MIECMAYDEKPYKDEDVGDEVYEDEGLEYLEENDEITPEEEAFMEGYKHTPPARLRKQEKKPAVNKSIKKKRKAKKKAGRKRR